MSGRSEGTITAGQRLADRVSPRANSGAALALALASFGLFAFDGRSLFGLVLGVILMDVGIQSNHVSNLARVHALRPEARSRINTVYMVTYFGGGALGTALGTWAWTLRAGRAPAASARDSSRPPSALWAAGSFGNPSPDPHAKIPLR